MHIVLLSLSPIIFTTVDTLDYVHYSWCIVPELNLTVIGFYRRELQVLKQEVERNRYRLNNCSALVV